MRRFWSVWALLLALLCLSFVTSCGEEKENEDVQEHTGLEEEDKEKLKDFLGNLTGGDGEGDESSAQTTKAPETTAPECSHDWEWTRHWDPATCQKEGEKGYRCKKCGEEKMEIEEKLPHEESDWKYSQYPSRTQEGKRYKECEECDEILIEEILPKTENSEGLKYSDNGDGTCTITGMGNCYDTEVLIPEKYDGLTVTAIGANCFAKNNKITTVTLPETVTKIGSGAFSGCVRLQSVNLPAGLTRILSNTFAKCESLTSIAIPDGVTEIGEYAFHNCKSLTSIYIPDSVTRLNIWAFGGCSGAVELRLSEALTTIPQYCFMSCTSLTSIRIPDSVTTLADFSFDNCTSVTELILSSNMVKVGDSSISDMPLTSIVVPKTVTFFDHMITNQVRIQNVFYLGTKAEWKQVDNAISWSEYVESVMLVCYSEEKPEKNPTRYWKYVDGVPTRWE